MALEELSFTYFPDNYRWSHGLLIGLNMAPWGGAEIGEVNRIGLRLKDKVGDDDAWFREWTREARAVEDRGRERMAEGHTASGAQYLQRASAYYHVGERFLQPKSKEGNDAYRRGVEAFATRRNTSSGRAWSTSKCPTARPACRRSSSTPSRPTRRQSAGHGVLRRPRRHQGNSIFQGRRRPRRARHRLPDRRRPRQRREHPLPQSLSAPRYRALRDAGVRLSGVAARGRPQAHRRHGDQPRRLLRAARGGLRAALRLLHRLGRAVGLPEDMGGPLRAPGQGRHAVAVGRRPAHLLGAQRQDAARGAQALEPFKLDGAVQKIACPS